jgi:uncharacterized membrane protein YhaH (DUF805 family)
MTAQAQHAFLGTRLRLVCGVLAGPLYLLVSYAQAFTRDGFDLTRDAFSYLSLGDAGWIQIANFMFCGLLFVVAATGLRQTLRGEPGGVWGPLLIGAMGAGMIAGGAFVVDPAFGYPPGAPAGTPPVLSWHGMLHGVAFTAAMLSWIAACFVFTRRFAVTGQRGWSIYSALTGTVLLVPVATVVAPPAALLIYIAATLGWVWTSIVFGALDIHSGNGSFAGDPT